MHCVCNGHTYAEITDGIVEVGTTTAALERVLLLLLLRLLAMNARALFGIWVWVSSRPERCHCLKISYQAIAKQVVVANTLLEDAVSFLVST
jgi:hypothetical protein